MAVIYVGCALSQASEVFKDRVAEFKRSLSENHEVLEFVLAKDVSDEFVFLNDAGCVERCDIFLAITDLASQGLGGEILLALSKFRKPVLCVYHDWDTRSRFIHGLTAWYSDLITFEQYRDLSDVARTILPEFLRKNAWRFSGKTLSKLPVSDSAITELPTEK